MRPDWPGRNLAVTLRSYFVHFLQAFWSLFKRFSALIGQVAQHNICRHPDYSIHLTGTVVTGLLSPACYHSPTFSIDAQGSADANGWPA